MAVTICPICYGTNKAECYYCKCILKNKRDEANLKKAEKQKKEAEKARSDFLYDLWIKARKFNMDTLADPRAIANWEHLKTLTNDPEQLAIYDKRIESIKNLDSVVKKMYGEWKT